jgi:two-component system response regulator (stage 0 sporulation protein F)
MARILLIDDDEHIRLLYAEELSQEGHEVITLGSGDMVLSAADRLQPEVVALDIKMGDYDGLELLQQIRNRHYSLPIILCSAYDIYKEDPRTMAADYYVVKSFDLSELKIAIQRSIEAQTAQRPAV